jgi:hypothetical protein
MRTFGVVLITAGLFGFVYASDQRAKAPALPEELGWREALEHPAGKWDMFRYAGAAAGGIGVLFLLFPKGR